MGLVRCHVARSPFSFGAATVWIGHQNTYTALKVSIYYPKFPRAGAPEEPVMTNIFISYSRNDRPVVQHIASALQQDGFNVWWDTEIPPGSTFADVIDKRLNEADCVLVIWSSSSVKSNWVQEEADDGLQSGRLIPVMIEEIDLPRGFKRLQTANLINWRGDRQAPEWMSVVSEVRRLVAQGQRAAAAKAAAQRPQRPAGAAPAKRPNPKPAVARTPPQKQQPAPQKKSGGGLMLVLIGLFIAVVGVGGYFFLKSDAGTSLAANSGNTPIEASAADPVEVAADITDESATASGDIALMSGDPVAEEENSADPAIDVAIDTPNSADDLVIEVAVEEPAKPQAGDMIKDCELCPELVVIGPGTSVLGAADGERSSEAVETPQIEVNFDYSFAIGRYEVTQDQWAACLADGGCDNYQPDDHGWGLGARPVINVSYENVQNYLSWLSSKTGATYRLPSEAEWEYAARSGTDTPFVTGDTSSTGQANFDGAYPFAGGKKERSAGKTLAVGSFSANAFGLYDMHGNVWEWVSDCWKASHRGADPSGAPVGGNCSQRVLKGGAWNGGAWRLRAAHRKPAKTSTSDYDLGFRVVREL